ncbi:hypothetical protein [Streptomyces sp. NBC_01794]|uniref:hypothetical protein n=1 Tax=Streptomyces sp. NBC_01794 TaxID=2975942 RepID=UPI003092AE1A|nr:hypothetical protein OIE54_00385 [Streptomyces sp. NBC_01794]WSB05154.1 hypothetical protein OIE54_41760 [Streptomyces sp. NBC_01794]
MLASILGYFNEHRTLPEPSPDVFRSSFGQYLHCIGHSFGGRFLTHAIDQAIPVIDKRMASQSSNLSSHNCSSATQRTFGARRGRGKCRGARRRCFCLP